MPTTQIQTPTDDEIRNRSYLLWESEGCQHGKDQEYWLRAKTELEAEIAEKIREASLATMHGETTDFVMPVLPISTPPAKSISDKLAQDDDGLKQAAG